MKRIVAYEAGTGDVGYFESIEEAEHWLRSYWEEGYVLEDASACFIAELKRTASAVVHDRLSNYRCQYEDRMCDGEGPCEENSCSGTELWPYADGHDEVLRINIEKV